MIHIIHPNPKKYPMKKLISFLLKALLTAVFGLFITNLTAQSIQNSVIGAAGTSATNGGITMDFTLGETVIETFTAGGNTLTQGFHQTKLTLVAIENEFLFPEISIYPNPATEFIHVEIPENHTALEFLLYDVNGKLLKTYTHSSTHLTIDVGVYARGTYYLQAMNPKDKMFKTFKVVKN